MHVPFRSSGIFLLGKGIRVFQPQRILYIFLAIDFRSLLLQIIESADIVKTSRVILMIMSQKDGIKVGYFCPEHLLSEVRTCIHKNLHVLMLYQHTGSEAFVTRVPAAAHIASAAYHRHSL